MVFYPSRIILLLFVGFLISFQPQEVSGLRSLEIAPRESQKENRLLLQNQHTPKATENEMLNSKKNSASVNNVSVPTKKSSANVNNKLDPNQSSKRRVRRGSDPIHNRA
ncbi:hypothetical protein P8452_47536 [Trifolium repens]|jgi:hypothetical protein|nr:hypothetical protein QL285_076108 [Trifolium repens]WJX62553.1 hypothetical protein P8452_47536 [Trifolium repens]